MVAEQFEIILKGKYPGRAHAKKVSELVRKSRPTDCSIIYVEGCATQFIEDSDLTVPFRQRRNFFYLTGCNLADCAFVYDLQSSESILFIPPPDSNEIIWSGKPLGLHEALQTYDIDRVYYTTDTQSVLTEMCAKYKTPIIYTIQTQTPQHADLGTFRLDSSQILKKAADEARVTKDEFEIAMVRKANHISSIAHLEVMKRVQNCTSEADLEAVFTMNCISRGAKKQAYPLIAGAGKAAATLHYEANDSLLEGKDNVLLDAGAEWNCYASDITRTFPISGTFSSESRDIYNLVLRMQQSCMDMIKHGVSWDGIHINAHRLAIDGLLKLGILKGDQESIFAAQTSLAFFPHGLGHYLGLDAHGTGGNANPHDENEMLRPLRKRGALLAGSVITVEPGIYFCGDIIMPYKEDPQHQDFIDNEVLSRYWEVGGVRIEDNVLVTEDGYESLTTVVKDVEDIENIVRAGCVSV